MGLAVTAYSHLSRIADQSLGNYDADEKNYIRIYALDNFSDRLDGFEPGWYRPALASQTYRFQAGTYRGYNDWRRSLSQFVLGAPPTVVWTHWEEYKGRPFSKLINFADNEGAIGPKTSAKLLADFTTWEPIVRAYAEALNPADDPGGWFMARYADWTKAFGLASLSGFVVFG